MHDPDDLERLAREITEELFAEWAPYGQVCAKHDGALPCEQCISDTSQTIFSHLRSYLNLREGGCHELCDRKPNHVGDCHSHMMGDNCLIAADAMPEPAPAEPSLQIDSGLPAIGSRWVGDEDTKWIVTGWHHGDAPILAVVEGGDPIPITIEEWRNVMTPLPSTSDWAPPGHQGEMLGIDVEEPPTAIGTTIVAHEDCPGCVAQLAAVTEERDRLQSQLTKVQAVIQQQLDLKVEVVEERDRIRKALVDARKDLKVIYRHIDQDREVKAMKAIGNRARVIDAVLAGGKGGKG